MISRRISADLLFSRNLFARIYILQQILGLQRYWVLYQLSSLPSQLRMRSGSATTYVIDLE